MESPCLPAVADPVPNPLLNDPSPSHAEDSRLLLKRVGLRDEKAMVAIFDRYSGMAYSIALRVLNDPSQAEDVIQDVFFQIWKNPGAFVPERGSLGAWLAVLVRNRSIDVVRRRKPSQPLEDIYLAAGTDIATEVENRSTVERVRGALEALPIEQRKTMESAFFKGMTHAEIAEENGEPLGTVKTRIRTALMTLRKAFRA